MAWGLAVCIIASALWACAYGGCNQKHAAKRNEVAYITSPGYPGNFTEYVDCYYELYSTSDNPGLLVYVDVVDVTLRCDDDTTHLHVYDGFSRRPRFLGRVCDGGQRTFESPKQTLYLVFRSRTQHAGRSRGFRLRVRTEPRYCHCFTQKTAVLDVTATPTCLTSPYYPYATEPNVNCRWLLKAPEDRRVNATVLHADMKGSRHCHHFGLYAYDGKTTYDDKLLASVCNNSVQSFQSSGPYLLIVFTSGSMVYRSGGGVKLQYSTIPADVTGKQLIGQTLFFVITALLILLILVITFLAVIKLFFLPRRRKQAERRRRAARARLTRVSRHGSSQSDCVSHSESGRSHASCSRASSSMSGSSVSSQLSGTSLTRLLSLYGLKKCRQGHRCGSSTSNPSPACHYNAQRSGVIIRVPGFSMYEAHSILPGELPPSYEEAIRQEVMRLEVTGGEVGGHGVTEQEVPGQREEQRTLLEEATGQEAVGQGVTGQEVAERVERQRTLLEEVIGQGVAGQEVTEGEERRILLEEVMGQGARGQGARGQEVTEREDRRTVLEEALRQESVAEALERAVVAEVMRQTAQDGVMGRPTADPLNRAADDEVTNETVLLREMIEQVMATEASEHSSQGQVTELNPQQSVRQGLFLEHRISGESLEHRVSGESMEHRMSGEPLEHSVSGELEEQSDLEETIELGRLGAGGQHTATVTSASALPCPRNVACRHDSTRSGSHKSGTIWAESAEHEHGALHGSVTDDHLIRSESTTPETEMDS